MFNPPFCDQKYQLFRFSLPALKAIYILKCEKRQEIHSSVQFNGSTNGNFEEFQNDSQTHVERQLLGNAVQSMAW